MTIFPWVRLMSTHVKYNINNSHKERYYRLPVSVQTSSKNLTAWSYQDISLDQSFLTIRSTSVWLMIGLKRGLLGLWGVRSQRMWSGLQEEKPGGTQQSRTHCQWHWVDVQSLAMQQEEASADRSSASGADIYVKVNAQELTLFVPRGYF